MADPVEHDLGDRTLPVRALAARFVIDRLREAFERPIARGRRSVASAAILLPTADAISLPFGDCELAAAALATINAQPATICFSMVILPLPGRSSYMCSAQSAYPPAVGSPTREAPWSKGASTNAVRR